MSRSADRLDAMIEQSEKYRVRPGSQVQLGGVATDTTAGYERRKDADADLKRCIEEIDALARILAAEAKRALLVILQGVDASGKDGLVRHVFTGVNPQVCKVAAFVEPDAEERAHDYLWRISRAAPPMGTIGVFNRSQYEDVLVLRARGTLSLADTQVRMRQIADLERIWTENGIVIRKFFLHISPDEQARRFEARLDRADKHWKVKETDFADRKLWPQFQRAYEDAISSTARPDSPWYIIPADRKWYRNIAIAAVVLQTLRGMDPRYPQPELDLERLKL